MSSSQRDHIEEIREERFWIGVGKNPLSKTLRMAVKYLSDELYSKDVHFLMELIQNAEDNEYLEGVEPSLEFMITSKDITATGAPSTLLIFNNEKGFSKKNMESICNVGDSTKAGNRKRGYIGEKGIGFKSIFLLTGQPYIFSNGYQIRFSEKPCPECDIAYIVPEWVDSKPSISDIQQIYSHNKALPTTTLILPLKPDKVQAVKEQLESLHPELLLFLSKIKRLSFKEANGVPSLNTMRAISISSERDFVAKKNIDAESYTVHLNANEDGNGQEGECHYYMWRQRFPVKEENGVEKRKDVEECTITLAFPFSKRLSRGMSSPGIYAFLPTETVTNFPFIIQADFLLPSSRETILWDNKWNQGILDCVPTAFVNAFVSLVKTRDDAPPSVLAQMFSFLPINTSCHSKLNVIRETIREKLLQVNIIPSQSPSKQLFFHRPGEVRRLMPSFWGILHEGKRQGVTLHNLSSEGMYILHSSFDQDKYNDILNFLGVEFVDLAWYPKCIQRCNLVLGAGEDVYVSLLSFLATNWTRFNETSMRSIPIVKYINASGSLSLFSIQEATTSRSLILSKDACEISWLIDWNKEFSSSGQTFFLPKNTQMSCAGVNDVLIWLRDHVNVTTLDVNGYASELLNCISSQRELVLCFSHFLYHSHSRKFLSVWEVKKLCAAMPVLDSYKSLCVRRKGLLVPANGSIWAELLGSNPWRSEDYVELADDYRHGRTYASLYTPEKELLKFLEKYSGASDIPNICPPNAALPVVSGPLRKQNAFLLLKWLRKLKSEGSNLPHNFKSSIEKGSWLKVMYSGCAGYKPPSESFLSGSSWGILLQNGSDMVDIPLIDQAFYGKKITEYEDELKMIGVMTECKQACIFIAGQLMSMATGSRLTKTKVISMLGFIRFLRDNYFPVEEFIKSIKEVRWVKNSWGYSLPGESVLFDEAWGDASIISQIPFLDTDYYGTGILAYKKELELLGVEVGFKDNYKIVIDNLKPAESLNILKAKTFIFALDCIRHSDSSEKIVARMKAAKCVRTNAGFMAPQDCFLNVTKWGCILDVLEGFPFVDASFYGSEIFQYKSELKKLGMVVDFDVACKKFCCNFKQQATSNSLTKENTLSFLKAYRELRKALVAFPPDFEKTIRETKWLRTRIGDHQSPKDCILFGADWELISHITLLPMIDDSENCYGKVIHKYRTELKDLGVVVDFEKGAHFVLPHIFFPADSADIAAGSVISLLQCIKNANVDCQTPIPESSRERIHRTKWLKTTMGYRSPQECLLFQPSQSLKDCSLLQQEDGPFIAEDYYGPSICSYKKELAFIGVHIDMCSSGAVELIANNIKCFSDFPRIKRIYKFLDKTDWKPADDDSSMIWIPMSSDDGYWASPKECILYDDNGLFTARINVLGEIYKPRVPAFFSKALKVRSHPSTDDYCLLWKDWEKSRTVLSHDECCAFWRHVLRYWNLKNEKMFSETVEKIPATSGISRDIVLVEKRDVFLPDDLLLKDLFETSSAHPVFVWCPKSDVASIPHARLLDIYASIGVRTISKSVVISKLSSLDHEGLNQVSLKDAYISKGLVMLILGFLADPNFHMETKSRHETLKMLLNVSVFEMSKPITLTYSLNLSSGDVVEVSTSQMVRWERESSRFYSQKLDKSAGHKHIIEYATKFAQVVSEGLLWEKEDLIPSLSELIRFGFLMDFDEDAVAYFMKSRNLLLFSEDEEFLSSVFPSC